MLQNNSKNTKASKLAVIFFLFVIVIAVFSKTTSYPFVNLDDYDYIIENQHVASGISLTNIKWAFTTFHAANWHPITWISHMFDCNLYGLNPWGHHLSNVLLHAANTVLLFLLLNRLTGALWRSALVSILFAIHPLRVESVAWISERKDVLSTMFLLVTLEFYVVYAQSMKLKYYGLALVTFAFGLLAKPMLVTLPFLLLLVDFWPLGRFGHQNTAGVTSVTCPSLTKMDSCRLVLIDKLPFLILSLASCIVTIKAQSLLAVISLGELPLSTRAANALVSYTSYIGKMLWPLNLGAYYPFPNSIPPWKVAGSFILLATISLLALNKVRRYPFFAFGWFWYVITLVPVIGLVQVGAQSIADRYTYIPLIGLFIAITWGGFEFVAKFPNLRFILAALSSMLLLTLAIVAYRQVGYWKDTETLFRRTLEVTKGNWFAHNILGAELNEQGKFDEAYLHLAESVQLNPQYSRSQYSLGISLRKLGRLDEAIVHYRAALQAEPNFAEAANNLADALLAKGNFDEAIALFLQLVKIQPIDAKYRANLAHAFHKKGLLNEALDQYLEALRINPNSAQTHNNLGSIYYRMGRLDKAAFHLSNALRLDPSLPGGQFLNYINSQIGVSGKRSK